MAGGVRLTQTVPRCPPRAHLHPGQASPVTAQCIAPGKCQKSQNVESFTPKIICANSRLDYFCYDQIFFFFLYYYFFFPQECGRAHGDELLKSLGISRTMPAGALC